MDLHQVLETKRVMTVLILAMAMYQRRQKVRRDTTVSAVVTRDQTKVFTFSCLVGYYTVEHVTRINQLENRKNTYIKTLIRLICLLEILHLQGIAMSIKATRIYF